MHTLRIKTSLLVLGLAVAACGSSGQGAASADAAAGPDALQDVVDTADVPPDAKDADTKGDEPLPDALPDTPPADTTKPGPDVFGWIDTNLTEPSDDCEGDAVYPPDGATLLIDVGPLLPANVVTGCGKGPPEPISFGNACCDCPPPYSCYCNGECGWLRGPDLKVPQSGGKAVWTGKWVVSVRVKSAIVSGQSEYTLEGQRWNPSGGGGWESIPLPGTPVDGFFDITTVAGKVYIKTHDKAIAPIRMVYDPYTNQLADWSPYAWNHNDAMAVVADKIVEIGSATKNDYLQGGLWVYDPGPGSWTQAPFPTSLLPVGGSLTQGVVLGDSNAAYLYDCIDASKKNPFPDGTFNSDVGHILKFDLATSTWSGIGLVPNNWRYNVVQAANIRPDGAILVGREIVGAGMQFARIENGNWLFGPVSPGLQESHRLLSIDTPCGAVLGSVGFAYGPGENDALYRVKLVRDDLSTEYPPVWGQPAESGTGLLYTQVVAIPGNVLVIGGDYWALHRETYRFPISQLCK